MTNSKYIKFAASLLLLFSSAGLTGQVSQTQYFMNLPQSNLTNPAFRPSMNVYIGLPAISGISADINNNMFSLSHLFQPMAGTDSVITILHPDYDRDKFLKGLGNTGSVSSGVSIQLLGVGFTVNDDWFIDISLYERAAVSANLPANLFSLLLDGNEAFTGETIDLSGLGLLATQYMESSIAISKNIGSKLRVGGRLKLLFGGAGASLEADRLDLRVNEDNSHTLDTDLRLNISGPLSVIVDEDGMIEDIVADDNIDPFDLLINPGNKGFAFDLGAEYRLLDNLSLSASIIDFGFIKWNSRTFNLQANNNFSFDGFDVTGVIKEELTFDEMLEQYSDSLKNSFDLNDSEESFTTWLPTRIFAGALYRPVNYLGLGLVSRTTITQRHVSQSLSLSANLYAGDILSTSLVYTMANRSYSNLGFGISVRMGPVQLYTVVDQIPANWTRLTLPDSDSPVVIPERIDFVNARFGLNLVFGKVKQKRTDTPMLLD